MSFPAFIIFDQDLANLWFSSTGEITFSNFRWFEYFVSLPLGKMNARRGNIAPK